MDKDREKGKHTLHPRNKHKELYDFNALILAVPELEPFVRTNAYKNKSLDFFDPVAVRLLNKALLKHVYGITYWDIPADYLCPPVPGRADYLHHIADLLAESYSGSGELKIPVGNQTKCLDIGVGANCIYPIIGVQEYGWHFIGSDTDPVAIQSASRIVQANPSLNGKVDLRWQPNPKEIFNTVLKKEEQIDVCICNPPFHVSAEEAMEGSIRKLKKLTKGKIKEPLLNFGGKNNELWCDGGEERFIRNMIFQSKEVASNCLWFTSLVAKQAHLKRIYNALEKVAAVKVKTIIMGQGNKTSRIIAWTFKHENENKRKNEKNK